MSDKPKVIVCQHGARHRYAIPRMLEQAGMLEALYTDSCEHSFLGKIAKAMGPLAKGSLRRLANRKIIEIPRKKVFSTDMFVLKCLFEKRGGGWLRILSRKMICWWGRESSEIVYNMYCENLDFLRYIQNSNAKIVCDVYISPISNRLMRDEYGTQKFLGMFHPSGIDMVQEQYLIEAFNLADILLCPSNWVADGVKELCPENAGKIKICPYGSSIDYGGRVNKPVKGRFFWAGGDWVRKGLHYLAEAADELKVKYPEMDFRVAGITDSNVVNMPRFKNLNFLGKLNKGQMQQEFLTADMFVFPTLSEGMAGTVIEAMAAGCPVITTRCAGIDVIDNYKNGVIVPERDSQALLIAIEKLYIDRNLRDSISDEILLLAKEYTENAWRKRLVQVLEEVKNL